MLKKNLNKSIMAFYETNQINPMVNAHYYDIVTMYETSRKIDREKEREAP